MPRTLKITLAYDGTRLVGWQRQADGVSVQGLLEEALGRIEGRRSSVVGSGRTDAGVHALGQVASTRLSHAIPLPDLLRALNAMLPSDVRIASVVEASESFHARCSAREKTYRYVFACGGGVSPFEGRYLWHLPQAMDLEPMAEAARSLEGEHDFAGFRSVGTPVSSTRRNLSSSVVEERGFGEVFGAALQPADRAAGARLFVYEVTGNGFLRHMVRTIAGSLIEIGAGRRTPAWLLEILGSGAREQAGPTAPARGLFLVRVGY